MTINPNSPSATEYSLAKYPLADIPISDRIRLVEDIWDSIAMDIAADSASLRLTDAQRAELDRRLEAYASDGIKGRSASEAIKDIKSRLHL
uniref:Putative addiction module component, TIGR02574 family n=1 Tax=Candidatus Kentrum sp. DK TaxID=2126562 RepID=A0A450S7Y2_9GAMM|nr:MAG: putative addiction module component, TIGR02574 family [Candidatus Kentron sp. DK]